MTAADYLSEHIYSLFNLLSCILRQYGSSRSQAEVQQVQQEMKYAADEQYVVNVLNYVFILSIQGLSART